MLLQSATIAEMVPAEFADGINHLIPGSYVEFAEKAIKRIYTFLLCCINAQAQARRIEANNADKIFESTYASQTEENNVVSCFAAA